MTPQLEVALRSFAPYTLDTGRRTRLWWLLSVLLHLAFFALLYLPLRRDFARVLDLGRLAPAGTGGGGGGGGGSGVAYIPLPEPTRPAPSVAVTPPAETPPPPVAVSPILVPTPVPVAPVPVESPAVAVVASDDSAGGGRGPGQGGGAGGGTGGGLGPGTGSGTGPGTGDGGGGGTGRAPVMRHMPIPPDGIPKEVRGVTFRVTFYVSALGRVERIAVDPPIRDRKYAEKFAETMMNYRFRPALSPEGAPIASTYVVSVDL